MSGKVAAVSGRATFEIIRERLGPRTAGANLLASFFISLMTVTAEMGGVALALQLATDVGPALWFPVAAFGVWVVIWRVKFTVMENVTGLLGLTLMVFAVAVVMFSPNWSELGRQMMAPQIPETESEATYWYFAVALFGAAMTPYEVFFFSSGAVEERWTVKDLSTSRLNVMVGFPLGGILSIAIAACAAIVLLPSGIEVSSLSQVVMPVVAAGGQLALAFAIIGIVAATFGAALETTLSSGYTVAQFLGWTWGKFRKPAEAARFHVLMIVVLVTGAAVHNTSSGGFREAGMLASELLGLPVEDSSGRGIGTVIDVRLVVDGDLHHDPGQPRVMGLVVSPRTRSSYLGYERTGVKHPVLLQKLLCWRHRGTFVCAWSDITRIDRERVSLRSNFTRYSPLLRT